VIDLSTTLYPCAGASSLRNAPRRPPPAATSSSPWTAQARARLSYLSRAPALQEAPQPVPLALSPLPQPQTPERCRRPPHAGEHRLTVDPPLCSPSARADPSICSTSTLRNSPTLPPHPEPVGATSPLTTYTELPPFTSTPTFSTTPALILSTRRCASMSFSVSPIYPSPPAIAVAGIGGQTTRPFSDHG
jgi:hypothetical protein